MGHGHPASVTKAVADPPGMPVTTAAALLAIAIGGCVGIIFLVRAMCRCQRKTSVRGDHWYHARHRLERRVVDDDSPTHGSHREAALGNALFDALDDVEEPYEPSPTFKTRGSPRTSASLIDGI